MSMLDLYKAPPTLDACEVLSRRHAQTIGLYALLFVVSLVIALLAYPGDVAIHPHVIGVKNLPMAIISGLTALFAFTRLFMLCLQLRRFEYVPQHVMDDLAGAEISLIAEYCSAVKIEGRTLMWDEVNRMLTLCKNNPAAYEKVKVHEKKHFWASILDHLFAW